ncbi:GNAT family N-acetyltransferase [Arenivirga flava]|uniref:N-acetyltransferase n=1 Tax=Arenivirga flava TaxID=1930060 RepID=A0AA37UHW3_9MICO|nr:GNAT family N-acetyltransferase [Arenivirga flava]GMA27492.1 N-acetyltransferase [Arenivirga flava]
MRIQDADEAHLGGIAAIYNDAVLHSTAIWNERTVDAADRAIWLADRTAAGFPVLVALDEHDVVGYASYGPWRAFDGFRHTVEHSVYVRGDQRGKGVGRALMKALIGRARTSGVHVMVAAVERGNVGSIRLHEQFGFTHAGVVEQVGAKFGRWLDLAFLQLVLDDRAAPPAAVSDIR